MNGNSCKKDNPNLLLSLRKRVGGVRIIVVVSASLFSGRLTFSLFPLQYPIFTPMSCATLVSPHGTACGVRWGGRGGVKCVARIHQQPHMCFYTGLQFSLPNRLPIPDPIPAPVPAGDWGSDLCG